MMKTDWEREVKKVYRFKFGENWTNFIKDTFNENTVNVATDSTKFALE